LLTALVAGSLALTACSSSTPASTSSTGSTAATTTAVAKKAGPPVKFGSYVDTEGQVVGAAIVQLLAANGINVVDKTKFGTPDVVRKAYLQGDLDGAIDYTGSGAFYVGPQGDPLWSNAQTGYDTIRTKDLAQNGIVWTTPAPANNTESIAVTKDFAAKNNLTSLADFAAYVNAGKPVKLIGAQAWIDNPYGVKGYEKAYGFTLKKDQLIGLSNGDTAQFIKALANGTNGVNFAEVYATDGGLADLGLVVLKDPKSIPPVYNPTPVFRSAIITAYPEIPAILAPFVKTLTIENLQQLNKAVSIDGKDPKVVAREYLISNGLLKQ
jgi:osmoprotectant transport system substrate-binding protein